MSHVHQLTRHCQDGCSLQHDNHSKLPVLFSGPIKRFQTCNLKEKDVLIYIQGKDLYLCESHSQKAT